MKVTETISKITKYTANDLGKTREEVCLDFSLRNSDF